MQRRARKHPLSIYERVSKRIKFMRAGEGRQIDVPLHKAQQSYRQHWIFIYM